MTKPLRVDFHDQDFYFNERYTSGAWEADTLATLQRFLHNGDFFIDIGAWIGPVTCWAVELGASVLAVEPDNVAYEQLLVNTAGMPVTTLLAAVGETDGTAYLYNERNFFGDRQTRTTDKKTPYPVAQVSVRTLLQGMIPSLIKVDVEGAEITFMGNLTEMARQLKIPLHISWHEPWWPHRVDTDRCYKLWFDGFTLEGELGGWNAMVAVPK